MHSVHFLIFDDDKSLGRSAHFVDAFPNEFPRVLLALY